ncbi:MAG: hypothetical protein WC712_06280, partial [Candidatus Brocadiia bacterium]
MSVRMPIRASCVLAVCLLCVASLSPLRGHCEVSLPAAPGAEALMGLIVSQAELKPGPVIFGPKLSIGAMLYKWDNLPGPIPLSDGRILVGNLVLDADCCPRKAIAQTSKKARFFFDRSSDKYYIFDPAADSCVGYDVATLAPCTGNLIAQLRDAKPPVPADALRMDIPGLQFLFAFGAKAYFLADHELIILDVATGKAELPGVRLDCPIPSYQTRLKPFVIMGEYPSGAGLTEIATPSEGGTWTRETFQSGGCASETVAGPIPGMVWWRSLSYDDTRFDVRIPMGNLVRTVPIVAFWQKAWKNGDADRCTTNARFDCAADFLIFYSTAAGGAIAKYDLTLDPNKPPGFRVTRALEAYDMFETPPMYPVSEVIEGRLLVERSPVRAAGMPRGTWAEYGVFDVRKQGFTGGQTATTMRRFCVRSSSGGFAAIGTDAELAFYEGNGVKVLDFSLMPFESVEAVVADSTSDAFAVVTGLEGHFRYRIIAPGDRKIGGALEFPWKPCTAFDGSFAVSDAAAGDIPCTFSGKWVLDAPDGDPAKMLLDGRKYVGSDGEARYYSGDDGYTVVDIATGASEKRALPFDCLRLLQVVGKNLFIGSRHLTKRGTGLFDANGSLWRDGAALICRNLYLDL